MMKIKTEKQKRHEKLIDFLSQFSQYQTKEGQTLLQKVNEGRMGKKIEKISIFDVNLAVVAFTDVLNIMSGSAGNIDLYRLLQAYLTVPEYRGKINDVVNEAHSFVYTREK